MGKWQHLPSRIVVRIEECKVYTVCRWCLANNVITVIITNIFIVMEKEKENIIRDRKFLKKYNYLPSIALMILKFQ